ncbi:MAG TPA: YciI family protein [bacterium]|nr:YciI family protein [bacterium]
MSGINCFFGTLVRAKTRLFNKAEVLLTCLFFAVTAVLLATCTPDRTADSATANAEQGYDSTLAAEYGADPYGMKTYVMAFLRRGPNRDLDSTQAAELQNAHLRNIGRMADEGTLVLAGPFLDDGPLRGIYVFDVETIEESKALVRTDPAIQAGSLTMELKEWRLCENKKSSAKFKILYIFHAW